MEPGQEEGVNPEYDSLLHVKTDVAAHELGLDCGVILRAIDTLLLIAPREFRSPKEWMLRLYKTRTDVANAVFVEAEANVKKTLEDESGSESDLIFLKRPVEGEGADEYSEIPDIQEQTQEPD